MEISEKIMPYPISGFYVNKPIRFLTYNGDLKGDLNYTYFPTGICYQQPQYDNFNIYNISLSNLNVANSDIKNSYIHNASIDNCNIEDVTFINSTISNCWIGTNVTFINCPAGSDPLSGCSLTEYFSNQLKTKYDTLLSDYSYYRNECTTTYNSMKNEIYDDNSLNFTDKIFYSTNLINNHIERLYPIENASLFNGSLVATNISADLINLKNNISDEGSVNVFFDIDFEMYYNDADDDISYSSLDGYIHYQNSTDANQNWNNSITQINKHLYESSNDYSACYSSELLNCSGDNVSYANSENFDISFVNDNINITKTSDISLYGNYTITSEEEFIIDTSGTYELLLSDISMELKNGSNNNDKCQITTKQIENKVETNNTEYFYNIYFNETSMTFYKWTEDDGNCTTTYTLAQNGTTLFSICFVVI
jgi:hypothetical protein